MATLKELLTFDTENAYDFAYDLSVKKNYSTPKIYTANGDLSKRWFVYFSFRNPETGKLKRVTPIYGAASNHMNKEARLTILVNYRKSLIEYLKQGYNPFESNEELFKKLSKTSAKPVEQKQIVAEVKSDPLVMEPPKMTIREACDFGLKLKDNIVSPSTHRNYDNRLKNFIKWLLENYPEIKTIDQLSKRMVLHFLNEVLARTTARTRNNFRVDLSSIFQVLEDNEIISHNFIKKIPVLNSIPERNKTYTQEKQEEIFKYLKEKDPILLLYIKFISYNLLRPIEVNRLRVGDLNLTNKTIQFKAKNSPLKTKIIPELLFNDLPDLSNTDKNLVLFTPDQIGGEWNATVDNRRDYFTKRFKSVVKEHFNLGEDYGLYSFRHTYITKIYRELVKNFSPNEAEGKLMLITGHATSLALRKYLRDIDAELPADYSAMLT